MKGHLMIEEAHVVQSFSGINTAEIDHFVKESC